MRPNEGIGLHQGIQDLISGLSPKTVLTVPGEEEETANGELVLLQQIGLHSAVGEMAAQLVQPSAQGHGQSSWALDSLPTARGSAQRQTPGQ